MKRRIRVIRPWPGFELETDTAFFSTEIASEDADAVLCEWAPTEDLLTFPGPSAWYTCEPRTNPRMGVFGHPDHPRYLGLLRPEQLLHHAHEDPRFRVPHVTHHTSEVTGHDGPREPAAVAVVSNFGGRTRNRWPDIRFRNEFVTAEGVELFGRRSKWKLYRARRWSRRATPGVYRGEVGESDKIELLSRYHSAICLENTVEPWYFSEKFVDGVRAGCVPIYQAHPTVREGVLRGATWVDPGDFGLDVKRTLEYARSLDRADIARKNRVWLQSEAVRETSGHRVWTKIGEALGRAPSPSGHSR